jgi:hypothetical protein
VRDGPVEAGPFDHAEKRDEQDQRNPRVQIPETILGGEGNGGWIEQ